MEYKANSAIRLLKDLPEQHRTTVKQMIEENFRSSVQWGYRYTLSEDNKCVTIDRLTEY